MSTAGDLINITPLVLSDTFQTWMDRTNQIISNLNPLQVYDVQAGVTGGLTTQGFNNGYTILSVNRGPGIGTESISGQSYTIIDHSSFDRFGRVGATGASGFYTAVDDTFTYGDTSDGGKVKRILMKDMMPPSFDLGGTLRFNGDVYVNGLLTAQTFYTVASANLRVQDKTIELAFQQSLPISITGATTGSFTGSSYGLSAFHFTTADGLTADFAGTIQSYAHPSPSGITGTLTLGYPWSTNQVPDYLVGATGYISQSITGNPRYPVNSAGPLSNSFLSDAQLSEAGLIAKGADGDKIFWWVNNGSWPVNLWQANTNLGVSGPANAIVSRVYRSPVASGGEFVFASEYGATGTRIYLTRMDSGLTNTGYTGNTWSYTVDNTNNLVFASGTTGVGSEQPRFTIASGASGTTYAGITTTNWASGFNADQLDGAHASLSAAAWGIPVGNGDGRIDEAWLNATSLRRQIVTGTTHGLTAGNIVRVTSTGAYALAIATNKESAEVLGIVTRVSGPTGFELTYRGRVTGLSGATILREGGEFSPGLVYFLAGGTGGTASLGKMTGDPDVAAGTRLSIGEIRKSLFLATSTTDGIFTNDVGVLIPSPTDELYLSGLVPVGTIYSYSGDFSTLTDEWLLCDGTCYRQLDYPDLYAVIGRTFYTTTTANGTTSVTLAGGIRGLVADDVLTFTNVSDETITTRTVGSISGFVLTLTASLAAGTYRVTPATNANTETIFFVPDLRTRTPIGGSTGDSYPVNDFTTQYALGKVGGMDSFSLSAGNMPYHSHGLRTKTLTYATGGSSEVVVVGSGTNTTTNATGNSESVDFHTPYTTLNYIIRAKRKTTASMLTGHNHDLRYIRYDDTHAGLTYGDRQGFRANALVAGSATGNASLTGDVHDHDLRYTRFDVGAGATADAYIAAYLTTEGQYNARYLINAGLPAQGMVPAVDYIGATDHNHDLMYLAYTGQDSNVAAYFTEPVRTDFVNNRLGALNISGGMMYGGITFGSNNGMIAGLTFGTRSDHAANRRFTDMWYSHSYITRTTSVPSFGAAVYTETLTVPCPLTAHAAPTVTGPAFIPRAIEFQVLKLAGMTAGTPVVGTLLANAFHSSITTFLFTNMTGDEVLTEELLINGAAPNNTNSAFVKVKLTKPTDPATGVVVNFSWYFNYTPAVPDRDIAFRMRWIP
jgi:microcystin-dependent protein